ncbi:MAG: hypothetical protein PHO09_10790 [Sphaerochaeta sp.]|nr:hypothetical protein [Sphaerochaeta sp.]
MKKSLNHGWLNFPTRLTAKEAGLLMTDVNLFSAGVGPGYFATKRFDRDGKTHVHMHTAGGGAAC